jgi:hypothetical protein
MRPWLTTFVLLLFGTCCSSAQLQFTQQVKVLQCDQTVLTPNSTIDAGATQVGLTTSPSICIVNTGTAPITLTQITVTGSDFSDPGNAILPAVIKPNQTAPAFVVGPTFAPTATVTRTGQISFTDDATGSPQTFMLTGTGFTDFGVNLWPALTVSNTQTITAGQRAEYLMSVSGATSPPAASPFTGNISLSCSNLPPGASCTFSPSVISLGNGVEFMGFNANVTTTAGTAASFQAPGSKLGYSFAAFLVLALALPRKRRRGVALIACLLLALLASCGGSSKTTPTPSGTFPFSVNASANGVTHSKTMVMVVK